MEFRLTYEGVLVSNRYDGAAPKRAVAKHKIRQHFHPQLKRLWQKHPSLKSFVELGERDPKYAWATCSREGFNFWPMVTSKNGLMCSIDILMLRNGQPGEALADIDNRLKTVFDALRMPKNPQELGKTNETSAALPGEGETPFYVLLEDDSLITHVSVTTDMLLADLERENNDNVRLVLNVKVSPYSVTIDNSVFL